MDLNLHVFFHGDGGFTAKLDAIHTLLTSQQSSLEKILMTEQEALAAIQSVAALTTKIGTAIGAEGDTLQKVNDEIDQILAGESGQVPATVAAALQALNPTIQAVSDNLDTHQALLTAILAKGQPAVPTTPVPTPTPAPAN